MRWAHLIFPVTGFVFVGMSFHAGAKGARQTSDPQPIFQAHCVACHSGVKPAANLDLSQSPDKLASLFIVAKGDPNDSWIIKRVTSTNRPMPPAGPRLADADIATLKAWISAQVPNPTPIFQAKCIRCHAGAGAPGGLDLTQSLADLRGVRQVKPGDATDSAIYQRVTSTSRPMPPNGTRLTDAEVQIVAGWINSLNDPTPVLYGQCMPCHHGANARGGLDLSLPLAQIAASKDIFKGDPDESMLIKRVTGKVQPQMPPGDRKLTTGEVDVLENWIQSFGK